ncbi:MAG: hypothetical protein A2Y17_06270 [Clostridiales bacterium GWF2_38_85]|nr:MAG: hypothetical protein A2Y17_06270 [Clostridiales bacterium GWF2_38_85]HBL85497.1 hypothetical protein [Clostridiales bacterium]
MKKVFAFLLFILLCFPLLASCQPAGTESKSSSENDQSESFDTESDVAFSEMFKYDNTLETTETPSVVETRVVEKGRAVFSGNCEEGATIYVEYKDKLLLSTKSAEGNYFFEVTPKSSTSPWDIKIYAKSDGKNLSEAVEETAKYRPVQESEFANYVWVGKDFWLFFTNTRTQYLKSVLFNDSEKAALTNKTQQRVDWLEQNCNGAKLIYILVPNPNTIYPEYMPEGIERPDGITLREQVAESLEAGGATVFDLTEVLTEHKNDEFSIYHNTDSHWTEYGAFFGYTALMNKIAEKFPAASPRSMEDFGFENVYRQLGDLYFDLAMDNTLFHELTTFANPKFDTPINFAKFREGEIRITDEPTYEHLLQNPDGEGKPDVLILRDSYSVMMFDYIAERCNKTLMKQMWEFGFDTAELSSFQPDYVIYILSEMNLLNISK